MPKNYFDERTAAGYDANSTDMFDPAVLDPAVDFLAGLASSGTGLELGIESDGWRYRSVGGLRVHGIELSPTAEYAAWPPSEEPPSRGADLPARRGRRQRQITQ